MRWRGNRQSSNIEDRRSSRAPRFGGLGRGGGGILRLLPMAFKLLGFKGTLIAIAGVVAYGIYSGNLSQMLLGGGSVQETTQSTQKKDFKQTAEEKQTVQFISVVLAETEDTWNSLFKQMGVSYQEPRLVLFRHSVTSACGMAGSAMGPFYCPADKKVYIDLSFYHDLKTRHNSPGDFAQAYVIAHEIGHHVQNLLGISTKVHQAKQKSGKTRANQLSVKLELQADCFAGVWAYNAEKNKQLLETGDLQEALNAASAIGDDRLQQQSKGYITPDSFTHGSSKQRVKWFKQGFNFGQVDLCNTFKKN